MDRAFFVPQADINQRIGALRAALENRNLDAAWISQASDLFYLTGTAQAGHLVLFRDLAPILFIRKYLPRAVEESGIKDIRPLKNLAAVADVLNSARVASLGIEMDVLPAGQYLKYQELLPSAKLSDISVEIRQIRMVKSSWELDMIRRAAGLLDNLFEALPSWLYLGMPEIELASKIEGFLRSRGHQGFLPMRAFNGALYYGNFAFGPNAAIRGSFEGPTNGPGLYPAVPAGPGDNVLERNQPIFIDIVSGVGGYMADATRVYCLGRLPAQLKDAHAACIEIQEQIVSKISPDISGAALCQIGFDLADKLGIGEQFMGIQGDRVSFIAHGLGLEIDELPLIAKRYEWELPEGSVIALEPKAVFSGKGAVGIENTWLIRADRTEKLLNASDQVIEIT
jgi:Xaa-Pro dipeptidase